MTKHRFVWHDLNTKDIDGSKKFYGEVFNWKIESESGPYLHISAGDQMIGGMRPMGADEQMPTSWLGYVGVDDVAATVSTITGAGGKVFMPTTTLPNVGTFAVTADPTGGVFAPWKSARPGEDVEKIERAANFTFSWDELMSTDPDAAVAFYSKVFGWVGQPMDMGPGGTYTLLNRPGVKNFLGTQASAGGVMKSPPGVPHSFWLPYVQVDNTDALCERASRLGAQIAVPPTDIPNVGRFACWMDPQQASIGIIQPAM
ncbi:MAG TPA: VOC family protein [Kofleriaceae bacterium]